MRSSVSTMYLLNAFEVSCFNSVACNVSAAKQPITTHRVEMIGRMAGLLAIPSTEKDLALRLHLAVHGVHRPASATTIGFRQRDPTLLCRNARHCHPVQAAEVLRFGRYRLLITVTDFCGIVLQN